MLVGNESENLNFFLEEAVIFVSVANVLGKRLP